jgi:hypothetical protein
MLKWELGVGWTGGVGFWAVGLAYCGRILHKLGLNGLFGSPRPTPELPEHNSGFDYCHPILHPFFRVSGSTGSGPGFSGSGLGFRVLCPPWHLIAHTPNNTIIDCVTECYNRCLIDKLAYNKFFAHDFVNLNDKLVSVLYYPGSREYLTLTAFRTLAVSHV